MSTTNSELSAIFDEMARALELLGANPFRVNAHAKVARLLDGMGTDIKSIGHDLEALQAIEGIGEGSAKKIKEFVETGRVVEHDELLQQIPSGLFEVMQIPGLGPKTVRLMWEKAGITDLATLKSALASGEIEKLPRMGKKTVDNIREAIDFASRSAGRVRIGVAMPIAEQIVNHLRQADPMAKIEFAGSLRRGKETIGDIDILAAAGDHTQLAGAFRSMQGVSKVLASGETKISLRLDTGLQVDLRMIEPSCFGAALLYFTGSKEHNVVLRERAIKRGYRLNEYGLFPDDGSNEPPQKRNVRPVAARTEESIYKKLNLPWIPPELREDRGEFVVDHLPDFIELSDIKAELHAHTTASDGRLSIEELANEAKRRGFHTIAVTDHSKSSVQANGLSVERLLKHIDAVHAANEAIAGITILAGAEVDILADGHLDYDDEVLAKLDIVVASPHVALKQEPKKATERLLKAIRHPLVHILGHPTGRLINAREGLVPDMPRLIEAAVKHDTALEVNANDHRLDLRDSHVRMAVEAGARIAINTDAHSAEHFDLLRYGILTARRGWLPASLCVNTWTHDKLNKWLKQKR